MALIHGFEGPQHQNSASIPEATTKHLNDDLDRGDYPSTPRTRMFPMPMPFSTRPKQDQGDLEMILFFSSSKLISGPRFGKIPSEMRRL